MYGIEVQKIKYAKKDLDNYKKTVVLQVLKSLAVLHGGSKATQFGVDIAPKVIVVAGLSSKNPFLNNLFLVKDKGVSLHIDLLKELIEDYKDRITTNVYIGLRKGYLANEDEVLALDNTKIENISIIVKTPVEIAQILVNNL